VLFQGGFQLEKSVSGGTLEMGEAHGPMTKRQVRHGGGVHVRKKIAYVGGYKDGERWGGISRVARGGATGPRYKD